MISIIIPCYNRSKFIAETLSSVINQSYENWECLVVDDGSADNSLDVINEFVRKESRIRLYRRNREPKGASTCRNIGMEKSNGELIIFLDSDDLLATYCLEQRVAAIARNRNKTFWVFPMLLFKEKINDINIFTNLSNEEDDLFRFLRSDLPWSISCVVWLKSFIESLNGFDENFQNCQDHDLHLRALWKTKNYLYFINAIPDNFYRQHSEDKIYDPRDQKRLLVGARMLISRNADVFYNAKGHPQESEIKNNILIYFKYLIKQHLFINDFEGAFHLKKIMRDRGILKSVYSKLFHIYILLAKFGFNRIKGFYMIWDLIFFKYSPKTSWGKIPYRGRLSFKND